MEGRKDGKTESVKTVSSSLAFSHRSIQAPKELASRFSQSIHLLPICIIKEIQVTSKHYEVGEFRKRSEGDIDIPSKLPVPSLGRAFSDIGRDGDR